MTVHSKSSVLESAGLPLNSKVPELSVIDIQGTSPTIAELSGENGLIIILFRSADWCPFCKKHLLEVNDWSGKLEKLGYQTVGISYDSTQILKEFSSKMKIKFPLLSDQMAQTMIDFRALNQEYKPDSRKYGIPYPGVMVINKKGELTFKYFYQGYKKRVNMQKLYEDLSR